ncbi:Ribosomal RNA large subunit methyltransferase N [Gossypium arboreum]|uniref:Ribosomal RNA large subunit methyltransferase N n=1 Tax=Gossypium arboreum TaxID=29729 RepID=A0A0B0N7Y6_GOSAR|nr:Ribosomal RNA large subunit methyltransferase N [Gossypium arboreum]
MPLSQIGSYTNQIRCQCPRHGFTRNYISMLMSQTWSYTRTHIKNPMS